MIHPSGGAKVADVGNHATAMTENRGTIVVARLIQPQYLADATQAQSIQQVVGPRRGASADFQAGYGWHNDFVGLATEFARNAALGPGVHAAG